MLGHDRRADADRGTVRLPRDEEELAIRDPPKNLPAGLLAGHGMCVLSFPRLFKLLREDLWQPVGESNPSSQVENLVS